jgi:hypothetical protein
MDLDHLWLRGGGSCEARPVIRRVITAVRGHSSQMITSVVDAEEAGLVVPTQGRGVLSSRSPMFGVVVGVVTCFERFS